MTVEGTKDTHLERPLAEIWSKTQELLSEKLSRPSFESFIRPVNLVKLEENSALIVVANDFSKNYIASKLLKDISAALSHVLGRTVSVNVFVDPKHESTYSPSIASIAVLPPKQNVQENTLQANEAGQNKTSPLLNPKYSFNTFVVGSHNRFCHSAAMAVADRPCQTYNPLFIYGGVGLGKTHIMQAIGHHIILHSPNLSVRYITCERFTNELVNSIRENRMVEFRKRYRQVDVLLIDDVQFIEGKESTQEELFHTFNALRDSGRQIVLSSDRSPKAIATLEERLRSRFEWGLVADIQVPDFETRLAILSKKADCEKLIIPDEILEYIASNFTNNIRELEGALLRVHAYASLTGSEMSLSSAMSILQTGAENKNKSRPKLTIEQILDVVASYYKLETSDLKSPKRSQDLTWPRHVAMYLAHELLSMSFPRIGEVFGNRKHTSALYAYDKVREKLAQDKLLAETVKQISRQLSN
jgi:chromosomal replication initiator protein